MCVQKDETKFLKFIEEPGLHVFTVLTARKIGGEKMGVNAIILLIGFMPIYLNTPIVYTDSF